MWSSWIQMNICGGGGEDRDNWSGTRQITDGLPELEVFWNHGSRFVKKTVFPPGWGKLFWQIMLCSLLNCKTVLSKEKRKRGNSHQGSVQAGSHAAEQQQKHMLQHMFEVWGRRRWHIYSRTAIRGVTHRAVVLWVLFLPARGGRWREIIINRSHAHHRTHHTTWEGNASRETKRDRDIQTYIRFIASKPHACIFSDPLVCGSLWG